MSMSIAEAERLRVAEESIKALTRQHQELTETVRRLAERKKPGRKPKHG